MDHEHIHAAYRRFKQHIEDGLLPDMRAEKDGDGPTADVYPNEIDHFIAEVLGLTTRELRNTHDPVITNRMVLLAGDNSWAVYKMLLAQKGSSNEEEISHQL